MKKIQMLLLAAVLACSTADFAATADPVRTAIADQSRALMEAVKLRDAAATAALFTPDARIIMSGASEAVVGHDAIVQFWRGAFAGGLTALNLETTEVEGDAGMRIETGNYQVLGANAVEIGRGKYLLAWKRQGRDWKIFRDMAAMTPIQGAAAQSPAGAGFPAGYRDKFKLLAVTSRDEGAEVMSTYANPPGARIDRTDQLPYPDGSMFVMEFAAPIRDGEGQLMRDSSGNPLRGEIAHVDVMRHVKDFGGTYGESRAGEWEFASFKADGRVIVAPADAAHCAACHQRAGAARDFIFRPHNPLLESVP